MMPIDKKTVRKIVREQKKQLSSEEINKRTQNILKNLYEMDVYKNSERIYVYVNYNQEVNTSLLIEEGLKAGKEIMVPRVDNERMDFYRIHSMKDLESGAYGILEPVYGCHPDDRYEGLMILPGLAFDRKYHRIGYGGGFYDRYLMEHPDFTRIALCYDFQIFDEIESEDYDIPVELVISENGCY